MQDVQVNVENGEVYLASPYNAGLPAEAKKIGGRWDGTSRRWRFDARDEERVRDLARAVFGTDGRATGQTVTVRVNASRYEERGFTPEGRRARVVVAGRTVASREGRDEPVLLAAGVVLVQGTFPAGAGSTKYPEIDGAGVILEIRDLPAEALGAIAGPYTVVDNNLDAAALREERVRVAARLTEIDALLAAIGEPRTGDDDV